MTPQTSDNYGYTLAHNQAQGILRTLAAGSRVQASVSGPSRLQIALWILILVASLVLFFLQYSEFQIGAYHDDADYVVLAQSLVHSDTYGLINRPGEPADTRFPFGFPLLLVPIVLLAPENLDAFRAVSLVATLTSCALLFWGWKSFSRRRSYWWALAITGLYAFSPVVVDQSRMVMSEPIFTMFCLIALLLTEQAARRRESSVWPLWMGIVLMFVLFIRTVGFTLALAIVPYLLWKRGIRFALSLALVMLVVVLGVSIILAATSLEISDLVPSGYVEQLTAGGTSDVSSLVLGYPLYRFTQHLGVFLWQLLIPFGGGETTEQFFAGLGLPFVPTVLNFLLLVAVALGFGAWIWWEGISSFIAFAVVYLSIVYFWTWDGRRFMYPIEPQLQFALLLGIEAILFGLTVRWLNPQFRRRATGVLLCACAIFLLAAALFKSIQLDPSAVHVGDVYARVTWLKANTQPTDVIMTDQPVVDFVNGGRKAVRFRSAYDSLEALQQDLKMHQVKYILVAPSLNWQVQYSDVYDSRVENAAPLLDRLLAQNEIALVYSSPGGRIRVFKVVD